MKDELTLKNLKINEKKLLSRGFIKEDTSYKYETKIMKDKFLLSVTIENNIVTSDIIELSTNEKFILYYIKDSKGEYVGKMKEEYDKVLEVIKECSTKNGLKSNQTKLIIKYIKNKYGDELEYLWESTPNNAIARNKINNKWYLAILTIEKKKLGINEEGKVEIIDLRLEKDKLEQLVDNKNYFPGYHMNKKHWFTIILDDLVNIEEIYNHIDNSYRLSINK